MSRAVINSFMGQQVNMEYTPRVKDIIRKAYAISCEVVMGYIVTEHLLYALLCDTGSTAVNILENGLSVDINKLMNKTLAAINGEDEDEDYQSQYYSNVQNGYTNSYEKSKNSATSKNVNAKLPEVLRDMGVDMTERARLGKMDPIIGREKETSRIIEILCRKTKNNPVLIGEPGVGKTAIAEALAHKIIKKEVLKKVLDYAFESQRGNKLLIITFFTRNKIEDKEFIKELQKNYGIYLEVDTFIKEMNQALKNIKTYKQFFEYIGSDFGKNMTEEDMIIYCYKKAKEKKYINPSYVKAFSYDALPSGRGRGGYGLIGRGGFRMQRGRGGYGRGRGRGFP